MNVKYVGPARDYSGYGEANRHDIASLVHAGVRTTLFAPKYTLEIADYGKLGEVIDSVENKPMDYNVVVLHTTPNVYPLYMEPGKYHIGRVFWETNKLPLEFAKNVELMDEIWTGSEYNAEAIRNAGVTKPIHIIPEAIDVDLDPDSIDPYIIADNDCFKFYSIFEWTERKNPSSLLKAYWEEFQNDENVSLTIKTYIDNFTPEKKRELDQLIRLAKKKSPQSKYPATYIYRNLMDRRQIYRLHKTFDCFVSAHRGEGWGIPQMEAMLMGNPIISTNCGGIHEYLTDSTNAKLISYELVKLTENTRNKQWYTMDQMWAELNVMELRKAMRWAYENQKEAKAMGKKARELVKKKFSFEAVGKKMKDRLEH